MTAKIFIKDGGVKALAKGHPWVYAGGIGKIDGQPLSGDPVRLLDRQGRFLAWAWYAAESRVRARVISLNEAEVIDEAWLAGRLKAALERRRPLLEGDEIDAFRLVNAEADGLPGLTIDLYGPTAVLQAQSAGAESIKPQVVEWLKENIGSASIFERGDTELRRREGLRPARGPLHGSEPDEPVKVSHNGLKFLVDVVDGQRTGFYLDRRDAHALIGRLAKDRSVLDCFAYSGAFAVHALSAGATSAAIIDSSAKALKEARANLRLNGLATGRRGGELVQGNAMDVLGQYGRDSRRFDLIVLDPPDLAPSKAQAAKADKTYAELALRAMKILAGDGLLAVISSSASLGATRFEEIVHQVGLRAGRRFQITARIGPSLDHPALAGFSDSERLAGVVFRSV